MGDHVGILGVVLLSFYKGGWGGGGVAEPDPKGNLSLGTNLFSSLVHFFRLSEVFKQFGGGVIVFKYAKYWRVGREQREQREKAIDAALALHQLF